jgi:acetolactate synthase-1/2/3 large subunit
LAPTTAIGSDAFQKADVIGISRAYTRWNVMVKAAAELSKRIKEAFGITARGCLGPMLVDLLRDVAVRFLGKAIPS